MLICSSFWLALNCADDTLVEHFIYTKICTILLRLWLAVQYFSTERWLSLWLLSLLRVMDMFMYKEVRAYTCFQQGWPPCRVTSKPNIPSIHIWKEGMSAAERYKLLGEMFWWIVEYFWIVAWLQQRNEAVQQHSEGFDAACLNQMSVSCWAEAAQWSICKMHQIWKTDAAHTSPVAD